MKTLFLFLAVILFGCDSKSENPVAQPKAQADILTGVWCLRKNSPGFGPQESFNPNEIVWTFNTNNTFTVSINTTLPSNSRVPVTTNSTITYSLVNNQTITFPNFSYAVSIQNNKLILDNNSAADGPRIEFDKIQI